MDFEQSFMSGGDEIDQSVVQIGAGFEPPDAGAWRWSEHFHD
jgi:hypothetical protein